jgi:hypothetical protein
MKSRVEALIKIERTALLLKESAVFLSRKAAIPKLNSRTLGFPVK